jgi:hypothetical protein
MSVGSINIGPMDNRFYSFAGADAGPWRIAAVQSVIGLSLEMAPCLDIQNAESAPASRGERDGFSAPTRKTMLLPPLLDEAVICFSALARSMSAGAESWRCASRFHS